MEGAYDITSYSASLNGRSVYKYETGNYVGVPSYTPRTTLEAAFDFALENVGSVGTISGSAGQGLLSTSFAKGYAQSTTILDRAGHLNAYQRGKLERSRSLKAASKIFSSNSQSGKAIDAVANSKLGRLAKKVPILGHGLAWASVPADMELAPYGQKAVAGRAATTSVLGGYAVNLGVTAAAVGGLAILGFSAPVAVVGGAVVGIAASLGYDFGGYDDQVKDLYKEYGEPYYQKLFGK